MSRGEVCDASERVGEQVTLYFRVSEVLRSNSGRGCGSNDRGFMWFSLVLTGEYRDTTVRYEGVSKSFRTGRLERELKIVLLSATRCSFIAIWWVSLMSFASITLYVASQRVFIVVRVYFVIDSVRNLLDTPSYDMKLHLFTVPVHLPISFDVI
jgi:hypothetical protein